MSYRISIVYGHPQDPQAFDQYYQETHLDLARQIPGATRFSAGKSEPLGDTPAEAYALAQLEFATKEDALNALSCPAGQAAAQDLANFASGGATVVLSNEGFTHPTLNKE